MTRLTTSVESAAKEVGVPVFLVVLSVLISIPNLHQYVVKASSPSGTFPFRDDFNYTSIDSMVANGWSECGQGSSQSYSVSSGSLTLQDGAAMCWSHVPVGLSNWTATFRGSWSYNHYPSSGVEMVAKTSHHVYKFAAGEGNGLVVYRDNSTIINTSGWYPYCVVDGRFCYYTDFGVPHVYRLVMTGGVLTAYFDDNVDYKYVVGSYTESDPGTDLVMVSTGSGSDIGVVWSYVVANDPTTTSVKCAPSSVPVSQAATCTATVTETSSSATTPTGTVTFSTSSGTGLFSPSSCTLNNPSGSSASCSVNYTPARCPCYSWQVSPGIDVIAASYADATHAASSGTFSLRATALDETTVALSCSPNPIVINQATTCTVTVTDTSSTPLAPTGYIITGNPDNVMCTLGQATTNSARCSFNLTGAQWGSITAAATYAGDSSHYKNENTTEVNVNKRATATVISCSPDPVPNGTAAVCTAAVTDTDVGAAITPTGSVLLFSNSTGTFSESSCSLAATVTAGVASCSVTYTPTVTGLHQITGAYRSLDSWGLWEPGDSTHNGSAATTVLNVSSSDPPPAAGGGGGGRLLAM